MILFASEALSDVKRVREFLQEKNPEAAALAAIIFTLISSPC